MNAAVATYVWIAVGSALGGMARYGASMMIGQWFGQTFPWGTLLVNISGSFVIGFFATLSGPDGRLLVGVCGGYTTFSAFSLQTLNLIQDGEVMRAGANVGASVVLCLISVWMGYAAAASLTALRAS